MKIKAKHFLIMLACSTCLASCALGNGAPSATSGDAAVSESSYDETKSLNNLEFEVISEEEKTVEVDRYKLFYGDFRDWDQDIVIPKTVNGYRVVAIGYEAFFEYPHGEGAEYRETVKRCEALSNLKKILIPEGVTSIEESAFCACSSLPSISIPSSVTSIGKYAFSDCSALTELQFLGTTTQWEAVEKGDYWAPSNLRSVVCSDGTIYL